MPHTPTHALHTPLRALRVARTPHPRFVAPVSLAPLVLSFAFVSSWICCLLCRFFWISDLLRSLEFLDSDPRNGDDGRRVIHRRIRPLALLCLLTASPNTGKRLPLDEFVALDIRLRLGVLARPSAGTPRPMYEQLQYQLALFCYARLHLLCIDVERHILYSSAMYLVYTTSSRPPTASIAYTAR